MPTIPRTMPFPLALRYAQAGLPVRRMVWNDADGAHELAWLVFLGALYYYVTAAGQNVVEATDLDADDWRATDWTTLAPSCVADQTCACGAESPFDPADVTETLPPWIGDEPGAFDVENPGCCVPVLDPDAPAASESVNQVQTAGFNNPVPGQIGTASFEFTLPKAPGTYQLNLFANGDALRKGYNREGVDGMQFTRSITISYADGAGFAIVSAGSPVSKTQITTNQGGVSCTIKLWNAELSATANGVRCVAQIQSSCSSFDGTIRATLSGSTAPTAITRLQCGPSGGQLLSQDPREAPEITLSLTIDDSSCVPAGQSVARTFSGSVAMAADADAEASEEWWLTVRSQGVVLFSGTIEEDDSTTLTELPFTGAAGETIKVEAEAFLPGAGLHTRDKIVITFPAECVGT